MREQNAIQEIIEKADLYTTGFNLDAGYSVPFLHLLQ